MNDLETIAPGVSPVDLPQTIYAIYGWMLDIIEHSDDPLYIQHHVGTNIRNEIRKHACMWTDQELDDLWENVLRAGKRNSNIINLKYRNGEVTAE